MSTALPDADFVGPGSWTAADVAGYLSCGVPPRVMRSVLARWPHPSSYEAAWRTSEKSCRAAQLPAPKPPLTHLPHGCWMALAGTPEYPSLLQQTQSAPLLLFGRGNLDAVRPGIGVVGSRTMSPFGKAVADTAVAAAADLGVVVHSGGALGCDQAAHEAALAAGLPTVAVLATGADIAYPQGNADLFERIVAGRGAVISEHPFGTTTSTSADGFTPAPLPARLMARNRVVAGLSAVLVVCEAAPGSGTLGAVWSTLGMGRPVLVALPRPHARTLPGAQVPLGLASERGRSEAELRAMGAPPAVASSCAGPGPLASGTARDRDELTLLVRTSLLASPHLTVPSSTSAALHA